MEGDPESHVFDLVFERLDDLAAKLTVSMQMPTSAQERVKRVVGDRAFTNRDRHLIFEQIGEDLDFAAGMTVANAFLAMWTQERPEEVNNLIDNFRGLVPRK
jgi:hypothetical protein